MNIIILSKRKFEPLVKRKSNGVIYQFSWKCHDNVLVSNQICESFLSMQRCSSSTHTDGSVTRADIYCLPCTWPW